MNLSPMIWKTGLPPQVLPPAVRTTLPAYPPSTVPGSRGSLEDQLGGWSVGTAPIIPSWNIDLRRPVHPDELNPYVFRPATGDIEEIVITGRPVSDSLPLSSRLYQRFIAPWYEDDEGATPIDRVGAAIAGDDPGADDAGDDAAIADIAAERKRKLMLSAAIVAGIGLAFYVVRR